MMAYLRTIKENSLLLVILHIQIAPHPTLLYAHELNLPELTYDFDTSGIADLPSTTHVLMHHDICQPYYLCTTGPLMRVLMPTLLDETLQAIWAVCIHPGPFTLNGHLDDDLQVSNSCQCIIGYFVFTAVATVAHSLPTGVRMVQSSV